MANPTRIVSLLATALLLGGITRAATVPLRGELPEGAKAAEAIPFRGGVPVPKGALQSAENVRLLDAAGKELPCQVERTAVWPDGSVKWLLVDAVLTREAAGALKLEFGPDVKRAAVADPLHVQTENGTVRITGGGVEAAVKKDGLGVLERCTLNGQTLVAAGAPARLVVEHLRLPKGPNALATHTFMPNDEGATVDTGTLQIDELAVESAGPIRATVRLRGFILLPRFGATLPDEVKKREPPGRMPFSVRLSFHRQCPTILGQHQIVFSGEPDLDYITRWAIELPKAAGSSGRLILEPGAEMDLGEKGSVLAVPSRLCWAPLKSGFALIRHGWENRPCGITQENGSALIEFWPRAAGPWDLRRYAREWAVGESGDTKKPEEIRRFAPFAARGIAKSHDFAISLAPAAPALAQALSGHALLVAPSGWYALSEALGDFTPDVTSGPYAAIDATTRRRIDYQLFCRDLFQWYGQLVNGFWQTRFGEVHRTDRWENDYGRWGWSLNDGAGRVGHLLMLQYLRSLDRRYFDAGEAFNRINYDTNIVHTEQHLENCGGWWTAKGCAHRHNVQPFGCPYVGMRGSYPVGQRILHLLAGDGVIADGLEMVAETSFAYASGAGARLCNSGGSDGQGSAANALLWKFETTGDAKYLDACRNVLDKSELIPPKDGKSLGYGPSFGLFNAAGECAELSNDEAFRKRVIETAQKGAAEKDPSPFLYIIACAVRLSNDASLREKLAAILKGLAEKEAASLAELPPQQWPGHAGFRTPQLDANAARDLPYALALFQPAKADAAWPKAVPAPRPTPAAPPADWYTPGGERKRDEKPAAAAELLALKPGEGGGMLSAGAASWTCKESLADSVTLNDAMPLSSAIVPYLVLIRGRGSILDKPERQTGRATKMGSTDGGIQVATSEVGLGQFTARMKTVHVDGAAGVRIELACRVPRPAVPVRTASWGLQIPLKLSGKGNAIQVTTPGRFRLERCRLDQNDERIPNWLTSEYHWGEGAALWPKWRVSGISVGPGAHYRLWRSTALDVVPVYCDQGQGTAAWLDVTDRGATPRWGLTARLVRPAPAETDLSRQGIRVNLETGMLEIQFHDASADPLSEAAGAEGVSSAVDLIFHDGWRPPLAAPELTAAQYEKFLDDLNYGEHYGLFALRFCLSTTHKVKGRQWVEKIRDLGIEPREILYSMLARDSLAGHCAKVGVKWDPGDVEGSVRRVIEKYRK